MPKNLSKKKRRDQMRALGFTLAVKQRPAKRWGEWRWTATSPGGARLVFQESKTSVFREPGQPSYEIFLKDLTTSAEVLFQIIHFSRKRLASPEGVRDLLKALDAIFDVNDTWGRNKTTSRLTGGDLRRIAAQNGYSDQAPAGYGHRKGKISN
ncbi:MAG: hypothetical protein GEU82_10660 [Luteitalea sp.]|nr:hypothetical protein [Luteitalea sp.]